MDTVRDGWQSVDRRLEAFGPLHLDRGNLREANQRVAVHYGRGRRGR